MTSQAVVGYPASIGAPRLDAAEEALWLRAARREALERYEKAGLPTPRDEDWRHTNVAPIISTAFQPVSAQDGTAIARELLEMWGLGRQEVAAALVFIDGRHVPELSATPLGGPQRIGPIGDHWRQNDGPVADRFGRALADGANAFSMINTIYAENGACVIVPKGRRITAPIYLVFISTGGASAPSASHPRSIVIAGRESQATIVSVYGGIPGTTSLTNAVTELFLEDGATIEHTELQLESETAFYVSTLASRLGRDSRITDRSFAFGARLARRDALARIDGAGGACGLYGLYLADGDRHMDTHTLIDHAQPHTSSREVYKGILGGRSRGVFHGRIVVRPDAQKIDAYQLNKNLILSENALANSTPQLQIHADDVRCTHASTVGQLDPISLFYMRSRGIDETTARNLLTYAFACEIVSGVSVPDVRSGIARLLQSRLPGAPTELCS